METHEEKPTLNCVSLFSGIEAFSFAASRISDVNWNVVFFSEIDPFPCAVLQHHYPDVPNLGDICKIKAEKEGQEFDHKRCCKDGPVFPFEEVIW